MYVTFSTVYILAIGRTSVKYEPTIDLHLYGSPRSPLYLCGGAWKRKIRGWIPCRKSDFFLFPLLVNDTIFNFCYFWKE